MINLISPYCISRAGSLDPRDTDKIELGQNLLQ